jgi:hypothetical protein
MKEEVVIIIIIIIIIIVVVVAVTLFLKVCVIKIFFGFRIEHDKIQFRNT